ncbi:uncharacterized protein LOC120819258 isoform X2 [Gasterosteus aculeatus]
MEQRRGSLDHLQPQDLPTASIPNVIDLTRKGEECVLSSPSLDALRMVKDPCWYPNSVPSNPELPFLETGSSETVLQSGDPIQPEDAFSHTTVTLSYMSRSHVFSSHNSLYGVPPIGKLSLHPPCDLDKGRKESGYALNQHYLEQVGGSGDLASQTDFFQSVTAAQVGAENSGGGCLLQESQKFEGGSNSSCREMDKHGNGKKYHGLPLDRSAGLEDEHDDTCASSGACADSSVEELSSVTGEDQGSLTSEALAVNSNKQNPRVLLDSVSGRDVCLPSRDYMSPLEDPVSPSAASLDNVEDVFVLPQASSSPSGDDSYLETVNEGAGLRTEGVSDTTSRLDASAENQQPVSRRKAVLEPLVVPTDDVFVSDVPKNKPKTVTSHMNGNAKALQGTLKVKKLPVRPGRGTRLDAIVMDINSRRYKVSGCIRNKKAKTSQLPAGDSKLATCERNATLSAGKRRNRAKAPFSVKTKKQKAVASTTKDRTTMNTDICKTIIPECNYSTKSNGNLSPKKHPFSVHKKSKSGPEDVHPAHQPRTRRVRLKRKPSSHSGPQFDVHNNSKEQEQISHPDPLVEIHTARFSTRPSSKSPKKSQDKTAGSKQSPADKTAGSKQSPADKTAGSKQSPTDKTTGSKQSPADKTTGTKQSPADKTTGTKQSPADKTTGTKQSPTDKTTGSKQSPADKTTGSKQSPADKTTGTKQSPADKTTGTKQSPADKTTGTKQSPADKTTGSKQSPADKTTGSKQSSADKTTGTKQSPADKTTGSKQSPADKTTGSKQSPADKTKTAGIRKKRPKKCTWSQYSSIFSPNEPEIKLKYINFREDKKDYRLDSLSPFVHVEHQQSASSLCTIINYPEELGPQHKRAQQQQAQDLGFVSAGVPSSSSLQLGRPSTLGRQQRALVCCLCERAANAMDLGDLHGPYYPEGYQPISKRPGLKEDGDDYSDADSSSYRVRGKRRKRAIPLTAGPLRPSQQKQKGLDSYRGAANKSGSPEAKRARADGGQAAVEDWYSPPVLPQQPCEYWLHEDCGIWSAGVFLVKGKVYGLEEAVRAAQETRCSACSHHGATLGCFSKGCANKYHYRCAVASDCELIEENFSMKCKKHKNRALRAPPGKRREDR